MYDSYVALGDSFTEGLDDRAPDGTFRGWADRVADVLASGAPGFRYANLAVRGRRLSQIEEQQVPLAVAMRPALATIAAGGNDILGLRCDVPALARRLHGVLERLVGTGATVLVFTGFDATGRLPLGGAIATRASRYNAALTASADELGARTVDLWRMPGLYEDRMWAPDRLHLSPAGHATVATSVLHALGVEPADEPVGDAPEGVVRPWAAARRADAAWARTYFAPWLGRKVRGRSSGDLVQAKRPELLPVLPEERRGACTSG